MPTTTTTRKTTRKAATPRSSSSQGRTVTRKAATKAKAFSVVSATPAASLMTVTPELAEEWMDLNEHNRNLRGDMVNGWAVDVNAGDWKVNGETLKFTKSGKLIDGQHRLMAIITAGRAVDIFVVVGLDEDVQSTVDIGIKRTLPDVLKLRGEKNTTQLAGVTRRVYLWQQKVDRAKSMKSIGIEIMEASARAQEDEPSNLHFMRQPGNSGYLLRGGIRPTTTQLLDCLDGPLGPQIRKATLKGMYARRVLGISGAVFGLCYFLFARLDVADADAFFEQVVDGESIRKGDPSFALRRACGEMRGTYVREEVLTAKIIKAWNYWQDGISMDVCSWKAGGRSPEAFPIPKLIH